MGKKIEQKKVDELSPEEKCLSELASCLTKHNCELRVVFSQTKALDQTVLAYDIRVFKKK